MEATTYPTTEQLTALGMVGRVITDGTRVGVLRMVDGPDWMVVGEMVTRPAWDTSVPPARLVHTAPLASPFPQGAYGNVRWHGTDYLTVIPLCALRRGVTLRKSHGN